MSNKRWIQPEAVEIKMDAEISSYQDDGYDPRKDGPFRATPQSKEPAETELEAAVLHA